MILTVENIKSNYPNVMTATRNHKLVTDWEENEREDDEAYDHCNYCIGGALQMALGEIEPFDDDARNGIFPSSDDLGDTLHWFLNIPYKDEFPTYPPNVKKTNPCHFYQHKGQDCVQSSEGIDETAYELADEITKANDRGDFDYAWSCVEVVLKLGREYLKENK